MLSTFSAKPKLYFGNSRPNRLRLESELWFARNKPVDSPFRLVTSYYWNLKDDVVFAVRPILHFHLKVLYLDVHFTNLLRELEVRILGDLADEDLRSTSDLVEWLLRVFVRVTHKKAVHELFHKVVIETQVDFLDVVQSHSVNLYFHLAREACLFVRAILWLYHVNLHVHSIEVNHFSRRPHDLALRRLIHAGILPHKLEELLRVYWVGIASQVK